MHLLSTRKQSFVQLQNSALLHSFIDMWVGKNLGIMCAPRLANVNIKKFPLCITYCLHIKSIPTFWSCFCLFVFFFVTVIIYLERLGTITLGTRGFFSRVTRSFVGRRRTRLRPKAEETSGEAARKNLWRRAPWFAVLDGHWPCL